MVKNIRPNKNIRQIKIVIFILKTRLLIKFMFSVKKISLFLQVESLPRL